MTDTPLPIPQPNALNDAKGQTTQAGYRYYQSLDRAARSASAELAAIAAREDFWGFTDRYPEARNITIRKIPFAFEVISVTCKTSTGSCTITPKINSTTITGTNGSATTSETERAATAANVGAAGDDVVVTVSAISGAEDLDVTIKYRRV